MPSLRVDSMKDIKGLACYLKKRFGMNARSPFRVVEREEEKLSDNLLMVA